MECSRPVAAAIEMTIDAVTYKPTALRYCAVHGSFSLAVACELAKNGPRSAEGITHMREALSMEGKQLAACLGVGAPTISKWEKGRQDVDRLAWLVVGSLVLDAAGMMATMSSRIDSLARTERPKTLPLEDVKQPAREVVAVEHEQRRLIVDAVRGVYDRVFAGHQWANRMKARFDKLDRKAEARQRRAIKAGKPIAEPAFEPHWTDTVEPPVEVNTETIELWEALKEIDPRFDDLLMIQEVLWKGRKDAKGAPKTAARLAWEARVEDPDRAKSVKWRDVEGTIAGRYYRALQGG